MLFMLTDASEVFYLYLNQLPMKCYRYEMLGTEIVTKKLHLGRNI